MGCKPAKFINTALAAVFLLAAVALSSCVDDGGSRPGQVGGTGGLVASVDWLTGSNLLVNSAPGAQYSHSPPSVAKIHALITGSDMNTIIQDFSASAGSGQIDGIPAGSDRTLTLQGLDTADSPIYIGSAGGLTITADTIADAGTITMVQIGSATPGITITPTVGLLAGEGGTISFTAVLDTDPGEDVTFTLTSADITEALIQGGDQPTKASSLMLTFTAANWSIPQTVTIHGESDSIIDGNQTITITTAAAASTNTNYNGIDPSDVSVTISDSDVAGITILPADGLVTTEAGITDSFSVVLNNQPAADVTIGLTSSDISEVLVQGGDSPATPVASITLTFTSANWSTPQTVTLLGQDDLVNDGGQAVTIVSGAAVSADSNYNGVNPVDVSVNNNDDDAAGISITPLSGLVTTEAGGTATFTVVLDTQPTGSVNIGVSTGDSTEALVDSGGGATISLVLTFTTGNWSTPQTVTVVGQDDAIDDGNQLISILTAAAASTDSNYNGLDASDVAGTNNDDDAAGISVTPTSGLVTTEAGATDSFTVVLDTQPTANVTIGVSSSDTTEALVQGGDSPATPVAAITLTFTSADWATPQTVTVVGQDDLIVDGSQGVTILNAPAASSDGSYNGLDPADVAAANNDNDAAGISVTPTAGLITTEAGATDSFTVVLDTQPTANVTIGVSSSDTTEALVQGGDSPGTPAAFITLTFTSLDWATPQTVTVVGQDDLIVDGSQPVTISTAAAASGDANYNGLNPADVSASNTDDDAADITITPAAGLVTGESGATDAFAIALGGAPTANVSISISTSDATEALVQGGDSPATPAASITVTFTPADWATPQTVTVVGQDDALDDGNQTFTIITAAASSGDPSYNGFNPPDATGTNNDDDAAGISVTPTSGLVTTEAGGTDSFTVVLDTQPTANVTIGVSSSDATEALVQGGDSPGTPVAAITLTFTSADWSTPQTVTVLGQDDALDDGNQAITITTAAAVSTDADYNGLNASDVSGSNTDNDAAGISVTPTTGLVTTEAGATDSFTVVLDTQPTANVTIGVSSSDTTEALVQGGDSPGTPVAAITLTFTSADWSTPQTVTVVGQDDAIADGSQAVTITTAAAVSTDGNYSGLDPSDVTGTNNDDDAAGISVTPTAGLVTTEAGGTDSFTVVLDTQPTANVTIGVSSSDTTEALVQGGDSPGTPVAAITLTFTTADWATPQTVTVLGQDDALDDGNQAVTLVTAAAVSTDGSYNGVNPSDVTDTNNDDEASGITVTPTTGLVTTEAGGTGSFTVVLDVLPTANVTIGVSSGDTTEALVQGGDSPGTPMAAITLTFTTADWATPQTVTVVGQDDAIADGSQAVTITTAAAVSSDGNYNGLDPADVAGTNNDDETAGVTVTPTSGLSTTEAGGTAAFTVVLISNPGANVTIPVSSSDTGEELVQGGDSPAIPVAAITLTFTSADWSTPQTVTVVGQDDLLGDGDILVTIATGDPVSAGSAAYDLLTAASVADVSVTNVDDEVAPAVPTVTTPATTSFYTQTTPVTVAGGKDANSSIWIDQNGSKAEAVASDALTTWSVSRALSTNTVNNFIITSKDAAGLIESAAVNIQIIHDTIAPAAVTITQPSSSTFTFGGDNLVIAGTCEADATVDLTGDDIQSQSCAAGTFSFTVNKVADTTYNFSLTQTDLAANTSTAATQQWLRLAPSISVTPATLTVSESGTTGTFNVVLGQAVNGSVVVDLINNDTTEMSVDKTSLTFGTGNWSIAQTVTVTGIDDAVGDGNQVVTLGVDVNVGLTTDTSGYSALNPSDVVVTVIDISNPAVTVVPLAGLTVNESGTTATFTVVLNTPPTGNVVVDVVSLDTTEISVSTPSLTFTTANWLTPQTVTVTGVDDLVVDGTLIVTVALSINAGLTADATYLALNPPDLLVTVIDNDAIGISVSPSTPLSLSESGTTADITFVLNTAPDNDVVINLASSDLTEATVSTSSLTFTGANWSTPQIVTVTGIDDLLIDGNRTVAITIAIDAAATLDTTGYQSLLLSDITAVVSDDDASAVTVTPTAGLFTSESGALATFTVVLNTLPNGIVVIDVASTDLSEISVDKSQLSFTAVDWQTPQTVTVSGLIDSIVDGNQTVVVSLQINAGSTLDTTGYQGTNPSDVTLLNIDNDVAGVTLNPSSGLFVTEGGGTTSFTVQLNTQPVGGVVEILVLSGDTGEVTVDIASLTFTAADWFTPQTVTLTGVDDGVSDGNQSVTISLIVDVILTTDTSGYISIDPPDATVTVTDNTPFITVTPTSGLTTTESGGVDTFTLVLNTLPTGDVIVNIAAGVPAGEVSVDFSQVTFTTSDWSTPQTVTLTGLDDAATDGNQSVLFVLSVDGATADTDYLALDPADVSVTNRDNESIAITVNPISGLVTSEGGGIATFDVSLSLPPDGNVVIDVASDTPAEVTVDKSTLTFTPGDWQTTQIVTVQGQNDAVADGDQLANILLTMNGLTTDTQGYALLNPDDVAVTNLDNEATAEGSAGSPLDLSASLPYSGSVDSGLSYYVVSGLVPGADYFVSINSLTDDLILTVYEDAFATVSCGPEDNYSDARPESCTASAIPADTLYILVDGANAAAGATFTVDVIPTPLGEGAVGAALDITADLPGYLGGVDSGDSYYVVTGLTPNQPYLLQLSALTANVDLYVHGNGNFNNQLCFSKNSTIAESCTATSTASGELYIRVAAKNVNSATFTVDVAFVPADEGSSAAPLDISGMLPYEGQVLTGDPAGSYYVITGLIPGSPYTINLNSMSGSAGLEVYDDLFTNLICSSNNPVNLPESCSAGVFANGSGIFYIHATCNTGTCQSDGATYTIQLQ